jgi:hypothetical protein
VFNRVNWCATWGNTNSLKLCRGKAFIFYEDGEYKFILMIPYNLD